MSIIGRLRSAIRSHTLKASPEFERRALSHLLCKRSRSCIKITPTFNHHYRRYPPPTARTGGTSLANAIVLYTHPDCSFSDALKDELDTAGTAYDEINLALRPDAWLDLEKLTGGERITPVMVEDGEVSVGFHGVG